MYQITLGVFLLRNLVSSILSVFLEVYFHTFFLSNFLMLDQSPKWILEFTYCVCVFLIHRASLVAQLVKNPPAMWETWVRSLGWEDPLEQGKATHSFSGLENSMDCIVHGVAKSQTRLSNFHF